MPPRNNSIIAASLGLIVASPALPPLVPKACQLALCLGNLSSILPLFTRYLSGLLLGLQPHPSNPLSSLGSQDLPNGQSGHITPQFKSAHLTALGLAQPPLQLSGYHPCQEALGCWWWPASTALKPSDLLPSSQLATSYLSFYLAGCCVRTAHEGPAGAVPWPGAHVGL